MDEIVKEFIVESNEGLDRLDRDFVELEKDPDDQALLANIFRCIHTIKGTCGFLGFEKLQSVTHVGENLLSRLRDGELRLTPESTSALLAMVDAVREIMSHIESGESEGEGDYSQLIAQLGALARREADSPTASGSSADAEETSSLPVPSSPSPGEPEPDAPKPSEKKPAGERAEPVPPTLDADEPKDGRPKTAISESSIRVDVELLDKLMNLVGELVLARNQVLQHSTNSRDSALSATTQRLNLITTELQEGVMKTRMQPIGNIWSKFPRIVRDLSVAVNKRVRIEMDGRDTELDKTLIEAIKDPLTHIVRNAIDHGIETPEERSRAGKEEEARIHLRAFHEGGQVNIEISDDGRGIDSDEIREKAVQRGSIARIEAARLSTRDVNNLLFLPGFSTAEKVTNISGRGVGMDVVRSNIDRIGGAVDIQSTKGLGTTLRIKIPLTLAIIPALIVRSGGDRFALPQVNLLELVRLEGEAARNGIEHVREAPVHRLRGRLLPLVDLNATLQMAGNKADLDEEEPAAVNIVVLQAEEQTFGLVVDEILDTEEIVVKPLGKQLKSLEVYAGATIMGDGTVALILDVIGLAHWANVASSTRHIQARESAGTATEDDESMTMLLFSAGDRRQVAIPLSEVSRLEEFPISAIEQAGGSEVMQYRGRILPLIRLNRVMGRQTRTDRDTIQVVVYQAEATSVGLVVDEILDIVEDRCQIHRCRGRSGIVGSAVIEEKVTDILDVHAAIELSGVDLFEDAPTAGEL